MKKPTKEIEWLREYACAGLFSSGYAKALIAYLDSIPEWPADLTRERLEELAQVESPNECSNALSRLAAIAPERGKRKVDLWQHETDWWQRWLYASPEYEAAWLKDGWRKVGEAEIDE